MVHSRRRAQLRVDLRERVSRQARLGKPGHLAQRHGGGHLQGRILQDLGEEPLKDRDRLRRAEQLLHRVVHSVCHVAFLPVSGGRRTDFTKNQRFCSDYTQITADCQIPRLGEGLHRAAPVQIAQELARRGRNMRLTGQREGDRRRLPRARSEPPHAAAQTQRGKHQLSAAAQPHARAAHQKLSAQHDALGRGHCLSARLSGPELVLPGVQSLGRKEHQRV